MKLPSRLALLSILTIPALPLVPQIGSNPPIPPSWTQRPGQSPTPTVHDNQPTQDPAERMRDEQIRKLGAKRQEQAKQDARKLLELATELQKELEEASATATIPAKASGNADEIAKLAKNIKSNLRPL